LEKRFLLSVGKSRLGSCWNGEEEKKIVGKNRIGLRVEEEERREERESIFLLI
jgi:hypothetical protein